MKSPGIWAIRWFYKPLVHGLALLPFAAMVYGFVVGNLGVNPIETLTHESGQWALRILLITLSITPSARIFNSGWLIHFRRLIGLYCFFYALMHFLIYLVFDLSLDFSFLYEDILDRPYITVGFSCLLILTLLSATSPLKIRQKLKRNWVRIHQSVYLAGVLAVVHFLWVTRVDDREPLIYAGILALLLGYRLVRYLKKKKVFA